MNGAARYRESVLATRPTLTQTHPKIIHIITAATTQPPYVYDPRVRRAETIDEYVALMKEADERGVPLYVNNGFPTALKIDFPGYIRHAGRCRCLRPCRLLFWD